MHLCVIKTKEELLKMTYEDAKVAYNKNLELKYYAEQRVVKAKEALTRYRANLNAEMVSELNQYKVEIEKLRITRNALLTNTEFKKYQIRIKRKELKREIRKYEKKISELNNTLKESSQKFPADYDEVMHTKATDYNIALKDFKEISNKCKTENKYLKKIINKVENKAKKAPEKLELYTTTDFRRRKELKSQYQSKFRKTMIYISNSLSYLLTLLIVLLEIVYMIYLLNEMPVDYMLMPAMLINIAFLLVLFLCALKIKIYNVKFTYILVGFSAYMFIRSFVVVPFLLKGTEYAGLRGLLIGLSMAILVIGIWAAFISIKRINGRNSVMVKE